MRCPSSGPALTTTGRPQLEGLKASYCRFAHGLLFMEEENRLVSFISRDRNEVIN